MTPSCPVVGVDLETERLRGGGVGRAFGANEEDCPEAGVLLGHGVKGGVETSILGVLFAESIALGVDPLFSSSLSSAGESPVLGVPCVPPLLGVLLPKVVLLDSSPDNDGMTISSKPFAEASMERREPLVRLSFRLSRRVLSPRVAFVLLSPAFGLADDEASP